jgi:hypothetical protein
MRALASLIVASALLGVVAPSQARAAIDRHAVISQASDDVAAPPLAPNALAPCIVAAPLANLTPVFLASAAPRLVAAPAATLPLYLRDRALLL